MIDTPKPPPRGFTGRRRQRQTRRGVAAVNAVARVVITVGGLATILAVAVVCIFLVSVVVPLLRPSKIEAARTMPIAAGAAPRHLVAGEYLTIGWAYFDDGTLRLYRLDDGKVISEQRPLGDAVPTAAAFAMTDGAVAFGFADGTIRSGTIGFTSAYLDHDAAPPAAHRLVTGQTITHEGGMLERTAEGQYRLQSLAVKLQDPVTLEAGSAVRLLDISVKSAGLALAAVTDSGTLHVAEASTRKNMLTGKVTTTLREGKVALERTADGALAGLPAWLLLAGLGENVYAVWDDGRLLRYDTRQLTRPALVETIELLAEPDAKITALSYQIGKTSLVCGDSLGRVRVWFRIRPEAPAAQDGFALTLGHELPAHGAAVTSLGASARTRMLAAGYADGTLQLFHVTSNQRLGQSRTGDAAVETVVLAPKDDAILAATPTGMSLWRVDAPHPETSLAAIFSPQWYEGYQGPQHVWQSSSGTDDFEPKYGLLPLIFGTIKATLYSMLFGAPLAILAAIYTSEMMAPRTRARVKPTIELMASLPSVVLGFLAALIVAPVVEGVVPQVLTCFVTVPFFILLGAHLWQLMPSNMATRMARYRLAAVAVMIVLGGVAGFQVGPTVDRWLFAGDIKAWLAGQVGGPVAGWLFPLLPASALSVALLSGRFLTPRLRRLAADWPAARVAMVELIKFLLCSAGTLGLALLLSWLVAGPFNLWHFDARGSFVDTYIQRNAMIVGFIMGFAIIPIIYTISEDALAAVPDHLRSGSLGCGATPWQTAVRIIVPTAMSGLFSALMIGLGRAVGETMIVLMAAGNTPVMKWNIFEGFRTLSANIAVELPEAVKDSTHYRMLFLAALTLFAITFVVNTVAETVRLRFRRRAYQL